MLKIVSGGQTGVDRAALDVAIGRGIAYGGWCSKGGLAEDMPNPPGLLSRYPGLRETPEADPSQRTEWNVRDTDRLMVLIESAGLSVAETGTSTRTRTVSPASSRVLSWSLFKPAAETVGSNSNFTTSPPFVFMSA